jgi:predicted PurR-regulated permease PerM
MRLGVFVVVDAKFGKWQLLTFRLSATVKGDQMVDKKCSRPLRVHFVLALGALLTVIFTFMFAAISTAAQAKRTSPQTKGQAPQSRPLSAKMNKVASKPRPSPSFHRDVLMQLEEGQRGLQRQLESLTGTIQRRTDNVARRIDSMADQLDTVPSAIQQLTTTQQLLTATVRSMRLLVVIIMGLLLVVGSALALSLYRLKQFGGSRLKDGKPLSVATANAPDEGFEPQWKVSS